MSSYLLAYALLSLSALLAQAQNGQGPEWKITAATKSEAMLQTQRYKAALDSVGDPAGLAMSWWADFRKAHQKSYRSKSEEDNARQAFFDNLKAIAAVNNNPTIEHWQGPNEYSDMTFSQTKDTMLMRLDGNLLQKGASRTSAVRRRSLLQSGSQRKLMGEEYPGAKTKDWVASKRVTPVKNQGLCGSCWAMAATTAIEAAYCIVKGIDASKTTKVLLSEQQLVDCATAAAGWWSNGCQGGYSDAAFDYVLLRNQTTDSRYPYLAYQQTCNSQAVAAPSGQAVQLSTTDGTSTFYPLQFDVLALMTAVDKAPVVVYIEVSPAFLLYSAGVFTPSAATPCGSNVNHAVVVVGYVWKGDFPGSYWIIQNSWGTSWGESGRMRLVMQPPGLGPCGIYQYPMQPKTTFSKYLA